MKIIKPTTGLYSQKPYRCKSCGTEKELGTNHWGECYPWCDVCNQSTIWVCLEDVPEGYGTPKPWELVKVEMRIK